MAESSRCSTNQFSTQPATMLEANSRQPVKAAKSRVGPSSDSECRVYSASFALIIGCPSTSERPRLSSTTVGTTTTTLPSTAATCERTRWATSSTKALVASGVPMSLSLAAMAGAVMAGCLVARVRCSSWMTTKLAAYMAPAQKPPQKADRPRPMMRYLSQVVPAVSAPPPAALRSMLAYCWRSRVM